MPLLPVYPLPGDLQLLLALVILAQKLYDVPGSNPG